jgi:hypothetical protein
VTTATAATGLGRRYTVLHAGAVIAHGLSYVTTLWAVQWCAPQLELRAAGVAAYVLEFLLFAMKSALTNSAKGDDGVGWAGVGIDAVINAGGLIPYAPAILTFPPIAVLLALVGWVFGLAGVSLLWAGAPFVHLPYGAGTVPISLSVLNVGLAGGILLSAMPQRLWRRAERG